MPATSSSPAPRLRRRAPAPRWLPVVARWAVALLTLALATRLVGVGWQEILQATSFALTRDPWIIAAVVGLQALWSVSLAQLQRRSVLAVGGELTSLAAQRISMASFTLSRAIPGGGAAGGVFQTRELTRLGHPAPVAFAATLISWAVATATLALLVVVGTAVVAVAGEVPWAFVVPAGAVLAVLATAGAVLLVALRLPAVRRRLVTAGGWLLRRVRRDRDAAALGPTLEGVAARLTQPRRLLACLAWSATSWACDVTAMWLAFVAFGEPLGASVLLVGYASANLLNTIPEVTPGWIGVFETALAGTFVALGVDVEVAVPAVLAYRLASFWLPVMAGIGPVAVSLARARTTAPQQHPTDPPVWHLPVPVPAGDELVEVAA